MEKTWTENFTFTSLKSKKTLTFKVYVIKAASVYYFGFEEPEKYWFEDSAQETKPVYDSIEQICQDITIKYKTRPYNYFFFYWHKLHKNRGVEQIEFAWEGPFPTRLLSTNKFCDYSKNPFLS